MKKITLLICVLPLLSACSPSVPGLPDVSKIITDLTKPVLYKNDVNQGSLLDRFKINQLKAGMSKAQVKSLIGSPSIIDPFHDNQWDYINHSTLHNKDDIHYRLTLTFKGSALVDINQTGIASLPALTDKEKVLEVQRIAKEKADSEALAKAKIQRLTREKEKAAAVTLKQKQLAAEIAKSNAMVKAKIERLAREKAEASKANKAEKTQPARP